MPALALDDPRPGRPWLEPDPRRPRRTDRNSRADSNSRANRGAWLPTRYEDVAAIAYDTERFSSRSINLSNFRPPWEFAPVGW
ncbi:MAG: hypothetical protein ACLP5E_27570 [Streptosporangiaceae bacterium]